MPSAVVVGAGPNGLAAAAELARHGLRVRVLEASDAPGGGARSGESTVPGLIHDHCSAIHPMGAGSPCFASLGLERHGLRWLRPEVDCAHPLDDGTAAALRRSVDETAAGLGADGDRWRRLFGPSADGFDDLAADLLGPILRVPHHLLRLARFGPAALLPAAVVARWWRTEPARALYGGVAAHHFQRLDRPMSAAIGLMIIAAGHRWGWPVAEGGSQSIVDALVAVLAEHGGVVETGVRVRDARELAAYDVVLLDLSPTQALAMYADRMPPVVRRAFRRFRRGPAAFKLDLAIEGAVPWRAPICGRAGTVHLGGTFGQVAAAERQVASGRMPRRPYVLVGQQYVADPSRSRGGINPLYAYAHVPHGYAGDAAPMMLEQIERFAPGFRERVVETVPTGPAQLAAGNADLEGGDIVGGSNGGLQVVFRPRVAADPYSLGVPGVFLCSASTPPGAGVHGMCGFHAARSALRHLRIPA